MAGNSKQQMLMARFAAMVFLISVVLAATGCRPEQSDEHEHSKTTSQHFEDSGISSISANSAITTLPDQKDTAKILGAKFKREFSFNADLSVGPLRSTDVGNDTVSLEWDANSLADEYLLLKWDYANNEWIADLSQWILTTESSYINTGLSPGTLQRYVVLSLERDGFEFGLSNGTLEVLTTGMAAGSSVAFTDDGLTMIALEGGTFMMGQEGFHERETPVHEVTVGPFIIGRTEITVGGYKRFIPAITKTKSCAEDLCPLDNLTWTNAQRYIAWLNENRPAPDGSTYRMCTEAEWEFAQRGGTNTLYSWGDDESKIDQYVVWNRHDITKPQEAAMLLPNAFGLYNMHGNLNEWVQDFFSEDYYSSSPRDNPTGPTLGMYRVFRGYFYGVSFATEFRSSRRSFNPEDAGGLNSGGRLCGSL